MREVGYWEWVYDESGKSYDYIVGDRVVGWVILRRDFGWDAYVYGDDYEARVNDLEDGMRVVERRWT